MQNVFKKLAFIIILALLALLISRNLPDKFSNEFLASFENFNIEKKAQEENVGSAPGATAIKVPILVYHSVRPYYAGESEYVKSFGVEPKNFEKEMEYLASQKYDVISFDALADNLLNGSPLPPKPAVITLDDGWRNQYVYAFPILKKYNFTATLFIFTNAIGQKNFLSWNELREMDKAGMSIGGHTKSHPYLFTIHDKNILREEIIASKIITEEHLGKKINIFAYPFGHYSDDSIAVVKEAGYRAARSAFKGSSHAPKDIFTLKSIQVPDDLNKFILLLNQ